MIQRLRELLRTQTGNGVDLTIADDGYIEEGGWVFLVVTPAKPGIHAYEYVKRLMELERELRKDVGEQVMLLPAVPD